MKIVSHSNIIYIVIYSIKFRCVILRPILKAYGKILWKCIENENIWSELFMCIILDYTHTQHPLTTHTLHSIHHTHSPHQTQYTHHTHTNTPLSTLLTIDCIRQNWENILRFRREKQLKMWASDRQDLWE